MKKLAIWKPSSYFSPLVGYLEECYMILFLLYFWFFVANVLDYETTKYMINKDGFDVESKPILHWMLIHTHDTEVILLFKLLVVAITFTAFSAAKLLSTKFTQTNEELILISANVLLTAIVAMSLYCIHIS